MATLHIRIKDVLPRYSAGEFKGEGHVPMDVVEAVKRAIDKKWNVIIDHLSTVPYGSELPLTPSVWGGIYASNAVKGVTYYKIQFSANSRGYFDGSDIQMLNFVLVIAKDGIAGVMEAS